MSPKIHLRMEDTHREDGQVTTGAETGEMQLPAKDAEGRQQTPDARGRVGRPLQPPQAAWPCLRLHFDVRPQPRENKFRKCQATQCAVRCDGSSGAARLRLALSLCAAGAAAQRHIREAGDRTRLLQHSEPGPLPHTARRSSKPSNGTLSICALRGLHMLISKKNQLGTSNELELLVGDRHAAGVRGRGPEVLDHL